MIRSVFVALTIVGAAVCASQVHGQESKSAQTTRMKLKQKISVDFKEIRTADIFNEIKGEMEKPVNFKIDNVSGVSNNTKLTYKAKDKTVEAILNEMSDKFDFGWFVNSNASNNKIDGWVTIRKSSKGKERGYEAGKEPAKDKGAALPSVLERETASVAQRLRFRAERTWIDVWAIPELR
jgi:hypothetical protein